MTAEYLAMPATDRCANHECGNQMGRGAWVIVSMPVLMVGQARLPALRLSMCSPCATRLSHETNNETEGS